MRQAVPNCATIVFGLSLIAASIGLAGLAAAQGRPPAAAKPASTQQDSAGPLTSFGKSKEPVRIEAQKLQIYDKEQRAVYSGGVVAVQGKSTLRCTRMTIFYDNKKDKDAAPKPAGSDDDKSSSIKKMVCDGPVSMVSCTQTATGDHGEYEAATDLVILTGNVELKDGANVQNGDKLVYNQKDNTAVVTSDKPSSGRISGTFKSSVTPAKKPEGCT